MFLRALVAFLACPGMVALVIPLWIVWNREPARDPWFAIGLSILMAGLALLLWCVRDFYVAGKGTLAPWAPPRNLVVVGLYRYSRNPMYVAVVAIILAQALVFASWPVLVYAAFVWLAFTTFVVAYEEPTLQRTFGAEYDAYRANVGRWLPRIAPWKPQV